MDYARQAGTLAMLMCVLAAACGDSGARYGVVGLGPEATTSTDDSNPGGGAGRDGGAAPGDRPDGSTTTGGGDASTPPSGDPDGDGLSGSSDNCPRVANPDQADQDRDGVGDACDNCPAIANRDQANSDGDAAGDACQQITTANTDGDGDGVRDGKDNCIWAANPDQADQDGDGVGDACDSCPRAPNALTQDAPCPEDRGFPDEDADQDGVPNAQDNCPHGRRDDNGTAELADADQTDRDGDGVGDLCDVCPDTANADQAEPDPSACPSATPPSLGDPDQDGVPNAQDNCPQVGNPDQADGDGDGVGDACDNCPHNANAAQVDICHKGDGTVPGQDDDGDGVPNHEDNCPLGRRDGNGTDHLTDADQTDSDGDGAGDVCDSCPLLANYGDDSGYACRNDLDNPLGDYDGDGVLNGADNCPDMGNPGQEDHDLDGVGTACDPCECAPGHVIWDDSCPGGAVACAVADTDGDGLVNNQDNCPAVENPDQEDTDGDGVGDRCDNCADVANGDQDPFACAAHNPDYPAGDYDDDGVLNREDNCPGDATLPAGAGNPHHNPDQKNVDADAMGDACDNCPEYANAPGDTSCESLDWGDDPDGDQVPNYADNCPGTPNAGQADQDQDGLGDACDNCPEVASNLGGGAQLPADHVDCTELPPGSDLDGDGVDNGVDNCPEHRNGGQRDRDGDGVGDACDNCPDTPNNDQQDQDGDGQGDHCEPDLQIRDACAEESTRASTLAASLYFVVDASGSMRDGGRESAWENAAAAIAPTLVQGAFNVGVMQFAGDACGSWRETMQMTADGSFNQQQFRQASDISPNGATPTAGALRAVRTGGLYNLPGDPEPNRPKAVVLVTDGEPNRCSLEGNDAFKATVAEAGALAAAGIPVYVLGFKGVNPERMAAIAWAGDPAHVGQAPTTARLCGGERSRSCFAFFCGGWSGWSGSVGTPCHCADNGCLSRSFGQCTRERRDGTPGGCFPNSSFSGNGGWFEVSNTNDIRAAIDAIIGRTVSCELPIHASANVDPSLVTVDMITQPAGCPGSPGGCDIPPSGSNGYTIAGGSLRLHGSWCSYLKERVKVDDQARVELKMGCQCTPVPGVPDCGAPQGDTNCNGIINDQCSGGPETCGDGLDNDEDGAVDEGCVDEGCVPRPTICNDGVDQDCDGVDEVCPPPDCEPRPEVCGDGLDNDCDGVAEEHCQPPTTCWPTPCSAPGEQVDSDCDGVPDTTCQGPTDPPVPPDCTATPKPPVCKEDATCTPAPEVCDASDACVGQDVSAMPECATYDQDCDGTADEGCPPPGSCQPTSEVCDAVAAGAPECVGSTAPECAIYDQDCDGTADEGCERACTPYNELCGNGKDDNCDGQIDENCEPACREFTELCNGEDDNCNGEIDENCVECQEQAYEVCDGVDNDCDGMRDEGCPPNAPI